MGLEARVVGPFFVYIYIIIIRYIPIHIEGKLKAHGNKAEGYKVFCCMRGAHHTGIQVMESCHDHAGKAPQLNRNSMRKASSKQPRS